MIQSQEPNPERFRSTVKWTTLLRGGGTAHFRRLIFWLSSFLLKSSISELSVKISQKKFAPPCKLNFAWSIYTEVRTFSKKCPKKFAPPCKFNFQWSIDTEVRTFSKKCSKKGSHLCVNLTSNDRLTQRCELSAKIAKKRFAPLCKILETSSNLKHKVLKVLFQNFRSKSLKKSSHLRVNWTSLGLFTQRCELSAKNAKKVRTSV